MSNPNEVQLQPIESLSSDALSLRVGGNIAAYRKADNLTQLQFAEKLNYTDKAVSKWERGESLPDLVTLIAIANIFEITLNDLLGVVVIEEEIKFKRPPRKNIIIPVPIMSIIAIIAVTVITFVSSVSNNGFIDQWLFFIYALIPISVICIVFSALWASHIKVKGYSLRRLFIIASVSALMWSVALTIFFQMDNQYSFLIFICVVPFQAMAALFYSVFRFKKPDEIVDAVIDKI